VVETSCTAELVRLEPSGLLITPWHPVRMRSTWHFPADLGPVHVRDRCRIYSFALESDHILFIDGVECVGLAHGFIGEVVEHEYFGTEKVLMDLSHMIGYPYVRLQDGFTRGVDGRVNGFRCLERRGMVHHASAQAITVLN